tara:strand:+ start:124 stop:615 length:492 start_codon:yes stop_codon:yes gene_type:complete
VSSTAVTNESLTIVTSSESETRDVAKYFAEELQPGDVVALYGDLGAGKTVFVSAVAAALNVPAEAGVRSPSYTLMNLYEGGELPVAHLDLYRIDDVEELEALGFRDLLDGVWLVFIEWPERVPDLADDVTWRVVLEERDIEERGITLHARRSQSLERLRKCLS